MSRRDYITELMLHTPRIDEENIIEILSETATKKSVYQTVERTPVAMNIFGLIVPIDKGKRALAFWVHVKVLLTIEPGRLSSMEASGLNMLVHKGKGSSLHIVYCGGFAVHWDGDIVK